MRKLLLSVLVLTIGFAVINTEPATEASTNEVLTFRGMAFYGEDPCIAEDDFRNSAWGFAKMYANDTDYWEVGTSDYRDYVAFVLIDANGVVLDARYDWAATGEGKEFHFLLQVEEMNYPTARPFHIEMYDLDRNPLVDQSSIGLLKLINMTGKLKQRVTFDPAESSGGVCYTLPLLD